MIYEITSSSRTIRTFDESRPVTRETLLKLIDTARLAPSAKNAQPLRYRLVTDREECEKLVSITKYGAALPELRLPPEGHHPTAFIAVCTDTNVSRVSGRFTMFDAGLACQTMMLRAAEEGIGGVILASFVPEKLVEVLDIPERYEPLVLIALGAPAETVKLCDVPASGDTSYFRYANNVHYVPKRLLEDVLIK